MRALRETVAGGAVVAAWVAALGFAFRPGLASTDTMQQFVQGRSGDYTNLHPPLYSWLLGAVASPEWLFWVQLVLLASGLAVLALSLPSLPRRMLGLVSVLALPTLWAIAPTLWKDVLFAAIGTWVVVAMLHRQHALATVGLAMMACLRHNALFAAIPFAVLIVHRAGSVSRRMAWAAVLVAAQLALPAAVEKLARARDVWPSGQLSIFALASLQHEGVPPSPGFEDLAGRYSAYGVTPLIGVEDGRSYSVDWLLAHRAEVQEALRAAIAQRPLGLIRHRWDVSRHLFGFDGDLVCQPFDPEIDDNPWGWKLEPSRLRSAIEAVRQSLRDTILFRGWWWLLVAVLVMGDSLARRRWLSASVSGSAVGYALSLAATAPTCDFRYHYLVVVLCCCALLLSLRTARED